MTSLNVAILSLVCVLFGAAISKLWVAATKLTEMDASIAKAKQDNNNIGDKVRQLELKQFYVAMMVTPEEKRQEILNALVRRLT
jgi:hypothetical protein